MSRRLVALVALALLQACVTNGDRAGPRDPTVVLEWRPIAVPGDAEDVRYECAVYAAEQGLPRQRVLLCTGLHEPRLVLPALPDSAALFAVRARYRRGDVEWVTRWRGAAEPGEALVPQRGLRPVPGR